MEPKIKETLEKQLQLLSERGKKKDFLSEVLGKCKEGMTEKKSLVILGITVLIQSILLLKVTFQIRAIYAILLLLTERLNLLM